MKFHKPNQGSKSAMANEKQHTFKQFTKYVCIKKVGIYFV